MRNSIIKLLFIVSIALLSTEGNAQQDPHFTQYMYNMGVINPAYALDEEGLFRTGAIYRNQWVGMEGGPETATVFAQTALARRVELGINIMHDQVGDIVKESHLSANFAYVFPVSDNSKLSLGLKGGVNFFDADLAGLRTPEQGVDPAMENISETFPNFGVGAYWFGKNYYVGLSAPNLITSKHIENADGRAGLGEENIHYFLTGGYVFDLNDDLKLKPAFMVRGVQDAPLSVDITANALLYDRLEAGIGYRLGDALSGLVNFRVTPDLRIGYAYDYTLSNLGDYNDGTHEIMILFDMDVFSRGFDKSPRFF
ncbi:type IX secretion system membrane protein, PorP/SprF family [Salinimicrobium catena]|uniref:Type IX secretion system membrane protein, PorP/SprF family n=1 Tax=Salinimicrobium catena TaxID=390640 RepID=A0A1H5NKW9_9FLAO|nr:type IX secretion system membrane protein PorP/SprF [Salinimicrobium catena]SDL47861.1 type IX secretion system membrane protein, PorP/SprF family [Salinimicrobium catena]SEF01521.1 type IX secretion system membrane protein, PorP/SprF family [Salinimicrobium catena]